MNEEASVGVVVGGITNPLLFGLAPFQHLQLKGDGVRLQLVL